MLSVMILLGKRQEFHFVLLQTFIGDGKDVVLCLVCWSLSVRPSYVMVSTFSVVPPLELEEMNNTATKVFCLPFKTTGLDCLKSMVNDSELETKHYFQLLLFFGFCFLFRDGRGPRRSKLVVVVLVLLVGWCGASRSAMLQIHHTHDVMSKMSVTSSR